jgi:hypothetical protein
MSPQGCWLPVRHLSRTWCLRITAADEMAAISLDHIAQDRSCATFGAVLTHDRQARQSHIQPRECAPGAAADRNAQMDHGAPGPSAVGQPPRDSRRGRLAAGPLGRGARGKGAGGPDRMMATPICMNCRGLTELQRWAKAIRILKKMFGGHYTSRCIGDERQSADGAPPISG